MLRLLLLHHLKRVPSPSSPLLSSRLQDSRSEQKYTRSSRPSSRCVSCGAAVAPRAASRSATRSSTRSSRLSRTSWSLRCATASYSTCPPRQPAPPKRPPSAHSAPRGTVLFCDGRGRCGRVHGEDARRGRGGGRGGKEAADRAPAVGTNRKVGFHFQNVMTSMCISLSVDVIWSRNSDMCTVRPPPPPDPPRARQGCRFKTDSCFKQLLSHTSRKPTMTCRAHVKMFCLCGEVCVRAGVCGFAFRRLYVSFYASCVFPYFYLFVTIKGHTNITALLHRTRENLPELIEHIH